jgi:hypothetical protein
MNRQQYAKALAYVMDRYSEKWITLESARMFRSMVTVISLVDLLA